MSSEQDQNIQADEVAIFRTASDGSHPFSGGNVAWAHRLNGPSFPHAVGSQLLDYTLSTKWEMIYRLVGAISNSTTYLCRKINGQWWVV